MTNNDILTVISQLSKELNDLAEQHRHAAAAVREIEQRQLQTRHRLRSLREALESPGGRRLSPPDS